MDALASVTSSRKQPVAKVDLNRFADQADALSQARDAAKPYHDLTKRLFVAGGDFTLLDMFMASVLSRANGLHVATLEAIEAANPHAMLPLIRAYSDTVAMAFYVRDKPAYVEALTARRGEPKARRRRSMGAIIAHVAKYASGLQAVYDELSEGTHFGSIAMWMSWTPRERDDGGTTVEWTSYPRWRQPDEDPLIGCAWLLELSEMLSHVLETWIRARDRR